MYVCEFMCVYTYVKTYILDMLLIPFATYQLLP